MSLMPPPKSRFLSAASARNWKIAYDECNGLNMVDMLDSLQELGPDLLREMRAQMAAYDVWGGPNMPRIRFAMDVVELRRIPEAPGDLPVDQVQNARDFLAHAAESANIRTSIVTLARSFVATAHYLWGTAGNQPGIPNGNVGGGKARAANMRDPGLNPTETERDKVLAVCTAWSITPDGYNTCAGRSSLYAEKPDLTAFLGACAKKGDTDQRTWPGAGSRENLFPRKYYFQGNLVNPREEVWGESCINIRHFDCVGLVNYCYARHWYQSGFGVDIKSFRNGTVGTQPVASDAPPMDADILLPIKSNEHIAMSYHKGDNWFVVQAEQTIKGLTDSARFDSKKWDQFHFPSAYLRALHA